MARRRYLALAAVLLCAAALLLSLGEKEPTRVARPELEFPTHMREAEQRRHEERATLELPQPPPSTARPASTGEETAAPARRDPFLVSLPVQAGEPVVVLEANALRHSRLGELFIGCLLAKDPTTFSSIQDETGIDVLKDIDRVAFVGDSLVMSGFFDRARWSELEKDSQVEAYGAAGRIYTPRAEQGGTFGVWKDQLVILGDGDAPVRRALDQLEGRAPIPETGIPDDMAYGEVYGVIPGDAARKLLRGAGGRDLGDRIAAAASRIELHVDAMSDVAAVVRVRGDPDAGLQDLARSVGAALTVARVEAQATDDRRAADLLEFAGVRPGADQFAIDVALPSDRLEKWFEGCARSPAVRDPAR